MTDQEYLNTQELIFKFTKNEKNRKKLIENPEKIFKEEFKIAVPDDIKIKIIENKPNTYNFVIPSLNLKVGGFW
jgi:hypothetical protein